MTAVEMKEIEKRRAQIRQRIRKGGRIVSRADLPPADLGPEDNVLADWLAEIRAKGGFDLRLPDRLPMRDLPDLE